MKRSAGITISAVMAFIGSGVTLLSAALMAFSLTVAIPNGNLPRGFGYFATFMAVAAVLFAVWGIASGVGLLNLREWSRISIMVFAGLLLAISVPGLLMILFVKLPIPANSGDPETTQRIMWIARIFSSAIYGLLTILAVAWLYYFNLRNVKTQFGNRGNAESAFDLQPAPQMGPYSGGRPLSITIIAGLLMMGALSLPLFLVFHFPIMLLGYFFSGPQAFLIISAYAIAQGGLAFGLWELKPWGRSLAIYYFNFAIFNSIISSILPGAEARYETAVASMQASMNLPATPPQMHFPLWIALFFSLPFIGIQLWFLIASKKAFETPRAGR